MGNAESQIAFATETRDRATLVALAFAGQRISSSDGSYELLIELIQAAIAEAVEEATGDKRNSWDHDRDCRCSECKRENNSP